MSQPVVCQVAQTKPMRLVGEFVCKPGELTALVGPSGAGKTSMLRVLAGLMRPHQGRIAVGDQEWLNTSANVFVGPQQRRVGLVFQNYALMPHLHAAGNVALALQHLPKADRLAVAVQWLRNMRLSPEEAFRKPAALSGGQQQRVALARALAREPQLLLLDEPFSAVDQMNRESLYRLLADLRRQLNIPMVLVTHDLNEARRLCDALVVMDQGEVLQTGRSFDVHRRPRNARVADLVGIQNRFSGVWVGPGEPLGVGMLRWSRALDQALGVDAPGLDLQVKDKGKIPPGYLVNWVVHTDGLALHPVGEGELLPNHVQLQVEVAGHRDLGELSWVDLRMQAAPFETFKMAVAGAQRLGLKPGLPMVLHMDLSMIHIMPNKHRHGSGPLV
ncbi:ABC transporter ATP-binding protein [Limnobacter sp.]|uniref:ABC transporter ATP-binding protein n=1 Tax=Limnobacter sp. TaxID=2003368 RepID=UPI0035167508